MKLHEYVDWDELAELLAGGFISCKAHNELPLYIYNYTKKASGISAKNWSDTLSRCRGLIVDDELHVVAVGQPKFWNFNEFEDTIEAPFYAYDKMDGSMGIVYQWDGYMGIATRGSFHSEQAEWATAFLNVRPDYQEFFEEFIIEGYTPHVEIIYNENRIVVDYDYEDLVLLGTIHAHAENGTPVSNWFSPSTRYPGPVAESFKFDSIEDLLKAEPRDNTEGFVIFDSKGAKYKIKYEQYVALHRAIFNMTPKNLYELWATRDHEAIRDYVLGLPNEIQGEAQDILDRFQVEMNMEIAEVLGYMKMLKVELRKDFALKMQESNIPSEYRGALFNLWEDNIGRLNRWSVQKVKP